MKQLRARTRKSRRFSNRRGAAALEFALVAPTLLLVIFFSFEFSKLALMRSLANSAAYEACRHVIVEGAVRQDALDEAERILARLGTRNAQIELNDGAEIDASTTEVTCEIEIPMEDNAFLLSKIFKNKSVVSTITLKTERYTGYFDGGSEPAE